MTGRGAREGPTSVAGTLAVALVALVGPGAGLGTVAAGRAEPIRVVGTVAADTVTVQVPRLAAVAVDLDAGFPAPPGSAATTTGPGSAASPALALTGLGSVARVAQVLVRPGAAVARGQVLAVLDHAQQDAQVGVAAAGADLARAQVGVLDTRADEARDREAALRDTRSQVLRALRRVTSELARARRAHATLRATERRLLARRAELRTTRASLLATRTDLRVRRRDLVARRAALLALLAQPPVPGTGPSPAPAPAPAPDQPPDGTLSRGPSASPGVTPPTREELLAGIAELDAGIARVDGALTRVADGLGRARSGAARLERAVDRVAIRHRHVDRALHSLARARSRGLASRARVDAALAAVAAARRTLAHRRTLARTAVTRADLALRSARDQRDRASVTSPVEGVVLEAVLPGDVLAPGASLMRIRPDGPARVTTWLSAAQLAGTCSGAPAQVRGDWDAPGASHPATVTRIGTRWEYPPTSHTTAEVHLARAVPVELTVATGTLPAGVPVGITVAGCPSGRPASGSPTAPTTAPTTASGAPDPGAPPSR